MLPTLKACGNFCTGGKEEAGETGRRLGMLAVLTEDPGVGHCGPFSVMDT